ncbi:hypothetical protein [Thermococcus sp.]|uniref:hypothetical protein n=1 Tax=Thermococcus sp. TaxID=35749 RepID=UPI00261BC26E|nr:hypothetical protein [Thermococcus sp.]
MAYFLVAVATKENLKKCIETNLAGFTGSVNGYWAFVDIEIGDYISFLHGARIYNLYRVEDKVAIRNPDEIGPWNPIKLSSRRKYSFPFRLLLSPIRQLSESMVRPEFAYIAENLLLRGGYRKTHFQADEVTLHNVSVMGSLLEGEFEKLSHEGIPFMPKIAFSKDLVNPPEVFPMREVILQSLVRKALGREFLRDVLWTFGLEGNPEDFEVLGEKALPSGHVDLLIKPKHPVGIAPKVLIEVKMGSAGNTELGQLRRYLSESGPEAVGGILIARSFKRNIKRVPGIRLWEYKFRGITEDATYTYTELLEKLTLGEV